MEDVAFGGNPKGGKITEKGKIRTGKLDFDDVYFVKELKFNLFSVSHMCDKKNSALFTDTECIVLSSDFKLPDENHVLLRVPRENNMYNVDLKNIVPLRDLTCLFAKAILDESNLWHRRLGHINFKTMNKLVKATKDETSTIFKTFITGIENQINYKNGIAKRKNMTLIEAARTMLADSLLPIPFWAKAVNTTRYVQNRVLVTKPHNKTPYELLLGRTSSIGFMRPFGCPVTILNTLDLLGKFDGKADEGFLIGYSISSKAFRVFNSRTITVQDTLHIIFLENSPNVAGSGPTWLFDIDTLTQIVGPSNNAISLNFKLGGKSSYVDPSQYPDDPDMPALEDITYSDEKDVGVEADFSNLEINITIKEPKRVHQALKDPSWIEAMQEKLLQFKMQKFCVLVDLPKGKRAIGSKCVFRNNKYERGMVIRNKARLVTQGHTQKEGIDYEEVFASVARIEAIRLFLAYASFMGFMVYQMDVKSSFLYVTIEEEVYVCQPPGFEDPGYPDRVYKVVKAFYGLNQAPRAWYETLANYLLKNGFQRGKIDQTLFIKKQKGDILLVQVYVDDIIFGSTNKDLCKAFEKLLKDKFQISSMGELTFFLGLQVKQKQDGIFISQDKYVAKILRKFGLLDVKSASTPIDTEKPLLKDPDGEDVDVHTYRSMIGSLMYLTSSRLDIMFVVCACSHFQVTPKASHLHAVKRIFRYLKGKPHLGLWYAKDSPFNLTVVATSSIEAEYVAVASCCAQTKNAGYSKQYEVIGMDFACYKYQTVSGKESSNRLMADNLPKIVWYLTHHVALIKSWLVQKQTAIVDKKDGIEVSAVDLKITVVKKFLMLTNDAVRLQALIDRKKVIVTEDTVRQALRLDDADSINCLPNEEIFVELARIGYEKPSTKLTFYKAFLSAQWKFLIHTIFQCTSAKRTAWNEFRVDTPLFAGMLVPQQAHDVEAAAEDDNAVNEVSDTCATLTKQVANLEQEKIAQAIEITKLKQRVRRLEMKRKLKALGFKRLRKVGTTQRVKSSAETVIDDQDDASKQGKIAKLDADEDVTLEEVDAESTKDADETNEAEPAKVEEVIEVVTAAKLMTEVVTITAATTITATLVAKASAPRRRRGVIIQDPKEAATTSKFVQSEVKSKDKGKEILVEEPKPLKRQAQIEQDEAFAKKLEVELNANIHWNEVIKQVKTKEKQDNTLIRYQALKRKPITEAHARKNMMAFLEKGEKEIEEEESKESKRKSENLKQKRKIVQDRFESLEPKNFSDDFLLNSLRTMIEKPNAKANI
uniref:Retrovirus-related Pol polyprotein from transposon TNT 1-94 n=1 Tax=Tanacetum cinerariifolium TaxID=118510 RepID=A0A6L2N8V1_TANCI|nr:retrovirus-related Pol polyprotein from transposon TNT 1-94 [Tanacetum cinerariifolium]